jgi:hypothetical protein
VPLTAEQGQAALARLLDEIANQRGPSDLERLAQALLALGVPHTPKQGQAALANVLATFSFQEGRARQMYMEMVQALAVPLTPEQARAVLAPVFEDLARTTDPRKIRELAQVPQVLASPLEAEQVREPLARVRAGLAWASTPHEAVAWTQALVALLPREQPEPYVALIVELMKYPTAAGTATGLLLDALHRTDPKAPGNDAGLAATLAWLRTTHPAIDLDKRPACPKPPSDQQDVTCPDGGA